MKFVPSTVPYSLNAQGIIVLYNIKHYMLDLEETLLKYRKGAGALK